MGIKNLLKFLKNYKDLIIENDINDYKGKRIAIEKNGIEMEPVDISDLFAVEVDFQADLDRANAGLK